MIPSSRQLEALAERLDDIASALSAGLDAQTILTGGPTAGLSGEVQLGTDLVAALVARGLPLSDLDQRVLAAAESVGELPRALRERAEDLRFRAEVSRDTMRQLAYPVFLLAASALLIVWLQFLGLGPGAGLQIMLLGGAAALVAGIVWIVRLSRSSPDFDGRVVPGLRNLLRDLGEVPYLTALRGLHAAGVLLPEAHMRATATSPIAWSRTRLQSAQPMIDRGESLASALGACGAIDNESLRLITSGESAGELEDSLLRAATRRRDTLKRRVRAVAKLAGWTVYAFAVVVVVSVVLGFYGRVLGGIPR